MKRKKSNSFHLAHKRKSLMQMLGWLNCCVVNIYDAHFIVYLCAKFMCHVNWWQILFSQLPVDALFCLPTDGTHWMRSNKRTNEQNIYGRFSWLFSYLISFHLLAVSSSAFASISLTSVWASFQLSISNRPFIIQSRSEGGKKKHLRNVCVLTVLKWHLYGDANAIILCFYLPFDDCSIFIQWFQSNFCIIALHSPATECIGVRKRKQK